LSGFTVSYLVQLVLIGLVHSPDLDGKAHSSSTAIKRIEDGFHFITKPELGAGEDDESLGHRTIPQDAQRDPEFKFEDQTGWKLRFVRLIDYRAPGREQNKKKIDENSPCGEVPPLLSGRAPRRSRDNTMSLNPIPLPEGGFPDSEKSSLIDRLGPILFKVLHRYDFVAPMSSVLWVFKGRSLPEHLSMVRGMRKCYHSHKE
jgi:hypothetical protein